jgi:hypothetical protein
MLILSLLGCTPEFKWEGEWRGTRNVQVQPGTDPSIAETLRQVKLRINGGSFELIEEGMPRSGPVRFSGQTAYLETAAVLGRQPQKPVPEITLTANQDGTLTLVDPLKENEPVQLKREAQPPQ